MKTGQLYASQVFLGDAMWEIDVAGVKAPRLIAKDLGGFNGFEVGPDGQLYGPLWFKGAVARMNPANGAVTVLNSEFQVPAAVNLDGKGNLWVVDTRAGDLSRVDLATGRKTTVRKLSSALDNLAIAPDGTIYVSNMADNAVQAFDPATGALRTLLSGKLAVPAGLKIEGDTAWVADIFSFRQVDLRTGAVRDIHRMQASDLEYPFAVGLGPERILLTSWFSGSVQVLGRPDMKTVAVLHGLRAPMDAQFLPDGAIAIPRSPPARSPWPAARATPLAAPWRRAWRGRPSWPSGRTALSMSARRRARSAGWTSRQGRSPWRWMASPCLRASPSPPGAAWWSPRPAPAG